MSILSLPRQHLKHHSSSEGAIPVARRPRRADDTVPNLAAYHAPPAAHLRQGERDERALRFDDVTPEAPAAPVRPVRRELRPDAGRAVLAFLSAAEQHFSPEALTHGVELRSVPLVEPPVEEPADPWVTVCTLLAEPDPLTDWARAIESEAEWTAGRFDAFTARVARYKTELAADVAILAGVSL